ncbi:hypothetical protein [Acidisoma silvae]|uniref:hypothetical protein n=1 Tax=Acidisoma silvae TaxID=2802396 RepID=UPI001D0B7CB4|nr:hypothetical protein [Acidisoma silvae]
MSAALGYDDGMDERDDKRQGEAAADRPAAADADFQALAEDWIAIWQSELTAYLTDPESQAHWVAMLALWGEAAQAMTRAMPHPPGFAPGSAPGFAAGFAPAHEHRRSAKPAAAQQPAGADAAARPAPAADASGSRDDEVRRLEQRVAELERRLAADSTSKRGAAGADRGPRRGSRARG